MSYPNLKHYHLSTIVKASVDEEDRLLAAGRITPEVHSHTREALRELARNMTEFMTPYPDFEVEAFMAACGFEGE